jgi:hypothetical protein
MIKQANMRKHLLNVRCRCSFKTRKQRSIQRGLIVSDNPTSHCYELPHLLCSVTFRDFIKLTIVICAQKNVGSVENRGPSESLMSSRHVH